MLTDIINNNLTVLFVGINPGLKSADDGHHFSGKSNRFWKVLHQAGFTSHQIDPEDDTTILDFGYGLTTAVARPTSRADELSKEEFNDSLEAFKTKMLKFQPKCIAFLGKIAYKTFSGKKQILWGLQQEEFCGSKVWILPNPSGLNRGFSLEDLIHSYEQLYFEIQREEKGLFLF